MYCLYVTRLANWLMWLACFAACELGSFAIVYVSIRSMSSVAIFFSECKDADVLYANCCNSHPSRMTIVFGIHWIEAVCHLYW